MFPDETPKWIACLPNWLRWLLVFPSAVVGFFALHFLALAIAGFWGEDTGAWGWKIVDLVMACYGFMYCGRIMSPSRRRWGSWGLGIGLLAFYAAMLFLAIREHRELLNSKEEAPQQISNVSTNWLRVAAEKGDAEAQLKYGRALLGYDAGDSDGRGPLSDLGTNHLKSKFRADEIQIDGESDKPAAGLIPGENIIDDGLKKKTFSFEEAIGAATNQIEAVKWFRRAAEQGLPDAQSELGFAYEKGVGVKKDPIEAVRWYRKAAEQGDSYSQLHLGSSYANGRGVPKDEAEAFKWFRRAAEQDDFFAPSILAGRYANGQGVAKDEAEAFKWYRKAAENGDADVYFILGARYANGQGVARDEAEAFKWYRKAAENGDADVYFILGARYANGQGVARDEAEAFKWYRKAAENGNADAQFNLALLYEDGQGVPRDYGEAAKWYQNAAKQGVPGAQHNLALLYFHGQGVTKNYVEAYKWANLAASKDLTNATRFRDKLEAMMTPNQIEDAQRLSREFTLHEEAQSRKLN